jgi:hypothetical protein
LEFFGERRIPDTGEPECENQNHFFPGAEPTAAAQLNHSSRRAERTDSPSPAPLSSARADYPARHSFAVPPPRLDLDALPPRARTMASGGGDDDSGGKLVVDRYRRRQVLGEGTYGVVFKATDTKVPPPSPSPKRSPAVVPR